MSSNRFKVALVAATVVLGTLAVLGALRAGPSGAQQGSMLNCPQAGKWAIAVWDGLSGTEASGALATWRRWHVREVQIGLHCPVDTACGATPVVEG